jgi:hypothetical protein
VCTRGSLQIALYGGSADLVLSRAAAKVVDLRTALDRQPRADDKLAALLNTQVAAHPGLASAVYRADRVGAAGVMSMAPFAAAEAPVESTTLAIKLAAGPFTAIVGVPVIAPVVLAGNVSCQGPIWRSSPEP